MNRIELNLIAATEQDERGYADVPPDSINDETGSDSFQLVRNRSKFLIVGLVPSPSMLIRQVHTQRLRDCSSVGCDWGGPVKSYR